MPININNLHTRVNDIVNNIQQGRLRADRFNLSVNAASDALFKQRLGLPEQYDTETLKTRIGQTIKVHHDLNVFRKRVDLTVSALGEVSVSTGLPADYQIFEALRYKIIVKKDTDEAKRMCTGGLYFYEHGDYLVFEKPVRYLTQDRWGKRTESRILPPNKMKPVFTMTGTEWTFKPVDLGTVTLVYLKKPTRAVWGYTSTSGVDVYDPGTSVDLEWDEMLTDEIAQRVADNYLGNVGNLQAQQISREKVATGV